MAFIKLLVKFLDILFLIETIHYAFKITIFINCLAYSTPFGEDSALIDKRQIVLFGII